MDFGTTVFEIYGVATQGRNLSGWQQWVTGYTLSFSMDNSFFTQYRENGIVKVCRFLMFKCIEVMSSHECIYASFARCTCCHIIAFMACYILLLNSKLYQNYIVLNLFNIGYDYVPPADKIATSRVSDANGQSSKC